MAEPPLGATPGLGRREWLVVASAGAFAAVFALAAGAVGGASVAARIASLSPGLVGGLLALSLVNYLVRAGRWHFLDRRTGLEVPFLCELVYYLAGFAMTTTPGRVGEAMRLWFFARGHGYPYERVAGPLLGDRLADLNAVLILAVLAAAGMAEHAAGLVAAAAAVAVVTALALRPAPVLAAAGALHRLSGRRWPRAVARLRRAIRHAARLLGPRTLALATALGVVGWLAECLAFFLLLAHLGAPVSPAQAVFVFTFAMLAGAAAMLPGGLGGAEAAMLALLLGLGVAPATAIAATAVIRLTTLWFAVALGFAALPLAVRMATRRAR